MALPKKQIEIFQKMKDIVLSSPVSEDDKVTKDDVFQGAKKRNRHLAKDLCETFLKEDSDIIGFDNLINLHELSKKGKSCLIASEHKSNLDVPNLYTLFINKYPDKLDLFEDIIFIAGKKLNEETPVVKAFAELFNRVVIVPKFTKIDTKDEKQEVFSINRAAQKWIRENKGKGYMFLVYPTGTRTRSWKPETKKGIRETYNYLKNFDYICPSAIEGNTMPVSRDGSTMLDDHCVEDTVIYKFGDVLSTKEFIEKSRSEYAGESEFDIKQHTVDKLMELIYSLHGESKIL